MLIFYVIYERSLENYVLYIFLLKVQWQQLKPFVFVLIDSGFLWITHQLRIIIKSISYLKKDDHVYSEILFMNKANCISTCKTEIILKVTSNKFKAAWFTLISWQQTAYLKQFKSVTKPTNHNWIFWKSLDLVGKYFLTHVLKKNLVKVLSTG